MKDKSTWIRDDETVIWKDLMETHDGKLFGKRKIYFDPCVCVSDMIHRIHDQAFIFAWRRIKSAKLAKNLMFL